MRKINLLVFFVMFFSISNVYALEYCKESKEHEEYMKLTDKEKVNYIEPIYCEIPEGKKDSSKDLLSFSVALKDYISSSYTDPTYNSYTNNLITSPKNQYSLGTCWAFSSISVVESNALKNNIGNYDFSESHMVYSLLSAGYSDVAGKKGKYNVPNFDGGKVTYAASYYFNGYGQLLESEMPYVNEERQITISQYPQGRKIINVGDFGLANLTSFSACTSSEIISIKKKIINYGSVQASMYMDETLFDSNNEYYMATTSDSSLANHGISIVGWDDTVPRSKFRNATRDGAWIIKNSWGTSWSGDGFFYISYDDNFTCKSTATFYNVSTTSYDHTYASADMVGVPTFTLPDTFYMSSKFTKQGSFEEQLKRVSVAVGPNLTYKVYLSKNNVLTSKSDWTLLGSNTSDEYGIKSINLSNVKVNDDFTIIVEYTGGSSSVFTMCSNLSETSTMEYKSGVNYYSTSGNSWSDMSSIRISGNNTSCEPNIFVYTNEVEEPASYVLVNNISVSNSTATASLYIKNISTSSISYKIFDNSNNNVTSRFSITPDYTTNKVTIRSDGYTSGKFTLQVIYSSESVSKSFEFVEKVTSRNTSVVNISGKNVLVNISNNFTLTYDYLMNYLTVTNSTYNVYSSNNTLITDRNAVLTTNSKIKLNNSTYNIVIYGDVNCDGKISALDYIDVRKHIMGTKITDNGRLTASDMNKDSKISALDYIAIRKILMR